VRNFPPSTNKQDLEDLFGSCGDIKNIYIGINKEKASYAFVSYFDFRDAEDAMDKYKGYEWEGRKLCLDWDAGLENKRRKNKSSYIKY